MSAHARYRSAGGAVVLLALAAAAQQPIGQEPLIRITVGLVQVDAVVKDSRGRIVEGLEAKDFELLQGGKPRPITRFAFVGLADPARGRQPKVDTGPLPAPAIRPEQVRRTIVCLVDDLGIAPGAMHRVREGLRKFVREQIQPADLVSIVRTGSGMGALQTFTNNKEQWLATIDRLNWNPMSRTASRDRGEQPSDLPVAQTSTAIGNPNPAGEQVGSLDSIQSNYFALGSVATLEYVVRSLAKMPGRKSAIFFSEGPP